MLKVPRKIISVFREEDNFLLATHVNPDGDAIGSALALSESLESLGKEVTLFNSDPIPKFYRFLPGCRKFTSRIVDVLGSDPLLVLLDCNSAERASLEGYRFRRSVVLDHHETEDDFGDIKWIEQNAAATGLMVFSLLKSLGVPITEDAATNLYAAIAVDTGTFRYSNTSADVLVAGAELIRAGADANFIASHLYETWERKRFHLLVMTLDTLEIKNNIAMTFISKRMFQKTGTTHEDTENFANFPRMMDSVRISALFREVGNGTWKVSLRSKGHANVARIAEIHKGGGHKNAAGFRIRADLKSAKEALLKADRKVRGKG